MADNHSKESRSRNMAQIKGKNTLPEIMVRKFLFGKGFRYRINDKSLPGKPDIVLPKYLLLYSLTAVSGTDMPTANMLIYLRPAPNGGKQKLIKTKKGIIKFISS